MYFGSNGFASYHFASYHFGTGEGPSPFEPQPEVVVIAQPPAPIISAGSAFGVRFEVYWQSVEEEEELLMTGDL